VAVVGAAGALLLGGGLTIFALWRAPPAIVAQPLVGSDGRDLLHLRCEPRSCRDGTSVELDGSKSTFAGGESELLLQHPLRIGDNSLSLRIDRPGWGRDEVVTVTVPVAFRIRADVAPMKGATPQIVIRVDAKTGSVVNVDGRVLPLDAAGSGQYAIDETAAAQGPADESRVVTVDVPYSVAAKGGPTSSGVVSARVAVAPLRVDTPGERAVVDSDHILVAGRAAKGATVSVDDAPATVGPEGAFEVTLALPSLGERTVHVRGSTPSLTPRTADIVVSRVASLTVEAKALDRKKTIDYDALAAHPEANVGQPIAVEGEVIDSRQAGHHVVLLVDDRRGCAKGPCPVRVVLDQDATVTRGTSVRAYGRVATAYATPGGQTVPQVDAEFLVPAVR
jgi:hypothetical protein